MSAPSSPGRTHAGAVCWRGARWVGVIALLGSPTALAIVVWSQPAQPPTTRVVDCTEGGCHAETMAHEFLHGPTAVSACTTCHKYTDATTHTFELKAQGRELCDFCHIDKVGTEGPVVHEPVATGDCLSCHDPHGAATRKLLTSPTLSQLCLSCHEQTLAGTHAHEPAANGDCLSCHDVHTADHEGLLVMERRALCLSCHEQERDAIESAVHVHKPVAGDCLECHTPHVSEFAGGLKGAPRDLCLSCHDPIRELAESARYKHSALTEDRACLNCHVPHASKTPALQHADPIAACLACHKEPEPEETKTAQTTNPAAPVFINKEPQPVVRRVVAPPAPELSTRLAIAHGPVADADCAACHSVHGAAHSRLLKLPYTESFYQDFTPAAYELCFSCHSETLATDSPTTTATRFRNGSRNLHAVHVNKEQGRTCRACHTTHASDTRAQIRKEAPFGQWLIPLNFESAETGGSCAPGCHKPESYDREADP